MEKKNLTQAEEHRESDDSLPDAANSGRNRIYLPGLPGLARLGLPRFDFSDLLKGGAENMTIETKFVEDRVEQYVRLFEVIRNRVGDDGLAIAILEQCGKDFRVAQMRDGDRFDRFEQSSNGDALATPKQLAFLERLQVRFDSKNLTKADASRMIDEAQARSLAA